MKVKKQKRTSKIFNKRVFMTQRELEKYLWGAATQLRGTIDERRL